MAQRIVAVHNYVSNGELIEFLKTLPVDGPIKIATDTYPIDIDHFQSDSDSGEVVCYACPVIPLTPKMFAHPRKEMRGESNSGAPDLPESLIDQIDEIDEDS